MTQDYTAYLIFILIGLWLGGMWLRNVIDLVDEIAYESYLFRLAKKLDRERRREHGL